MTIEILRQMIGWRVQWRAMKLLANRQNGLETILRRPSILVNWPRRCFR